MNDFVLLVKNIKYHKFINIFMFIVIFLINTSVSISYCLTSSMNSGIRDAKNKIGADIVVFPFSTDYEKEAEEILYESEPSTLLMNKKYVSKMKDITGVTDVTSRLYLATMEGASCCENKIQLIATDLKTDFLLSWIKTKDLSENEIILGNDFVLNEGDTVKYFGKDFLVKEILPRTGTGYDTTGFISYSTANKIMQEHPDMFNNKTEKDVTSVIYINSSTPEETRDSIFIDYAFELSPYMVDLKLNDYVKNVKSISIFAWILNILMCVLGFISISIIIMILIHQRKNEYSSLMLMGKPQSLMAKLFFFEYFIIFIMATLMSMIFNIIVFVVLQNPIRSVFGCPIKFDYVMMVKLFSTLLSADMIITMIVVFICMLYLKKTPIIELFKKNN